MVGLIHYSNLLQKKFQLRADFSSFSRGDNHWEKLDKAARAQKFQEETQVIIEEAVTLFGDDVIVPGLNSNLGQNTARALDALLVWLSVFFIL